MAAAAGTVGVTVDHRLHGLGDYPVAADDVAAPQARALPDVPEGQHGFDMLDHSEKSRDALRRAMARVTERLQT